MRQRAAVILLAFLTTVAATFSAVAQDVVFNVAAPTVVGAGELFRVEFTVNSTKDVSFTPPSIEGFEIMAGPQESRSTGVEMINGDFTRTESTTYTYILQGFTPGIHTISAASVSVRGGSSFSTRAVSIEVVGDGDAAGQGGSTGAGAGTSGAGQTGGLGGQNGSGQISADDVFVRAIVSRTDVYKGEPIVVALKLFSRVPPGGLNNLKLPAFNGFWQQDITPSQPVAPARESSGGKVYDVYTLKEYLLYPQQSGSLTIEPFEAEVTILVQLPAGSQRNIFDELMGLAGGGFQEINKHIASQPVKVNVREWPAGAPSGFDGAVGDFSLEATPPPSSMKANTSATYTVRLSGTGNFPLIRAPRLDLPQSFEQYNVTTSDNTRNTHSGTSGYREFSYPFIPRSDGLYTIPALEFSFFDPRQGRYVTVSSRETSLEVVADSTAMSAPGGLVSGISREDLKIFGQDIRFIKRGSPSLHPRGRMFMWSPAFVITALLLVAFCAAGFLILRKYMRNMQSDRFVRNKRANKLALRRFRNAEASMSQGDKGGFYDEMLKALWGYMSDKLDIPMAELTKERIREELFERGVPELQTDDYIRIISECEQAQYSPAPAIRMSELYREGVAIVSQLEL